MNRNFTPLSRASRSPHLPRIRRPAEKLTLNVAPTLASFLWCRLVSVVLSRARVPMLGIVRIATFAKVRTILVPTGFLAKTTSGPIGLVRRAYFLVRYLVGPLVSDI